MAISDCFNSYPNRHAMSTLVAIVLASIFAHYFSLTHTPWIIIAALVMSFTTRTAAIRQALLFFLVIIIALSIAFFIFMSWPLLAVCFVFVLWLLCDVLVRLTHFQYKQGLSSFFLFYSAYVTAIYLQGTTILTLHSQILDIVIGSVIGLVTTLIILPPNVIKDFNRGIVMLLNQLGTNMLQLTAYFENKTSLDQVSLSTNHLDEFLSADDTAYPEWVYDPGFNRALRSGFRFFLVTLDQVIDVIHTFNALLSGLDRALLTELEPYFATPMINNHKLIILLQQYFESGKKEDVNVDWKEDIVVLEKTLQHHFPAHHDLIEISPQFYLATALFREMKDLRHLLLKLLLSLP